MFVLSRFFDHAQRARKDGAYYCRDGVVAGALRDRHIEYDNVEL